MSQSLFLTEYLAFINRIQGLKTLKTFSELRSCRASELMLSVCSSQKCKSQHHTFGADCTVWSEGIVKVLGLVHKGCMHLCPVLEPCMPIQGCRSVPCISVEAVS